LIVIDASAVVELLLHTETGVRVGNRALSQAERLCAPHLLDLEIAQVLRRFVQLRELTPDRGFQALDDFRALHIERTSHVNLLPRIWELRGSLTAYDAAYVALAEAMDSPLLTCDAKLLRAHGHHATVEVVR
jgi:predicted nucleic acid-binding protein